MEIVLQNILYTEKKENDIMIKLNSLINDITSLTFYGLWGSFKATYIFKAGHVKDILQKGFNTFSNGPRQRRNSPHPADE